MVVRKGRQFKKIDSKKLRNSKILYFMLGLHCLVYLILSSGCVPKSKTLSNIWLRPPHWRRERGAINIKSSGIDIRYRKKYKAKKCIIE